MPGWFVHLEAAHLAARRLLAGDLPAETKNAASAVELGRICHRWRNYYALGAIGPDLFYLLPDFKGDEGASVRATIRWTTETWQMLHDQFAAPWDRWMSEVTQNHDDLVDAVTGGLLQQASSALELLTATIVNEVSTLVTRFGDLFGLLTSGPPQGFPNSSMFWSDVFHYRRTTAFPVAIYNSAVKARASAERNGDETAILDAEARIAFASGWITHCATDASGHAFTNAKCGGPYRLHWQRHHLIENHMDASCYLARVKSPYYSNFGTSALHFRVAFRQSVEDEPDAHYSGRSDRPAYDYFAGLPAYQLGVDARSRLQRRHHFDLSTGPLPNHLCLAIQEAMHVVFPTQHARLNDLSHVLPEAVGSPLILAHDEKCSDREDDGATSGRPNNDAMQQMWLIAYNYLRFTSSDGLNHGAPLQPEFITVNPPPLPPTSTGVTDDSNRGADLDRPIGLLDLVLAVLACALYITQLLIWLVTLIPSIVAQAATFPLRQLIYEAVLVPQFNLVMMSRRLLAMTGFVIPMPGEIAEGLTVLGRRVTTDPSLIRALQHPHGIAPADEEEPFNEPSGRYPGDSTPIDPDYPRQSLLDDMETIRDQSRVASILSSPDWNSNRYYSGWVAPWQYPSANIAKQATGPELPVCGHGPYEVGSSCTSLLRSDPSDWATVQAFLRSGSPEQTEVIARRVATGQSLGGPVDLSMHLLREMSSFDLFGDFNLDSDRGYGQLCWDYERHAAGSLHDSASATRE